MNITEKTIKETEARTYAYLSSAAIGFLIAEILLLVYSFIYSLLEYLTYRNNEENYGEKWHYVDLNELCLCGCLTTVLVLALFFVMRLWIRKIKCIEKRRPVIIISSVLIITLLPIWGYLSILILAIINLF